MQFLSKRIGQRTCGQEQEKLNALDPRVHYARVSSKLRRNSPISTVMPRIAVIQRRWRTGRIGIIVVWLSAFGQGQVARMPVVLDGATPTQAVIHYEAPNSAACTVKVTETNRPDTIIHDLNPALFKGSDQDLSRGTTIIDGSRRTVTIGARTAYAAPDGKLYSRALQAATSHNVSVDCIRSAGVLSFTTQNPPLGNTYPEAPPFNPAGFGNYAWPTVDWTDAAKTYIDPMTGFLLKPAYVLNPRGQSGEWGNEARELSFAGAFDRNRAWNDAGNLMNGSRSGPFASYSGSRGDPVFLPFSKFGLWWTTIGGWEPSLRIWDDVRLTLYGFGSDPDPENRKVMACLGVLYAPETDRCAGPEIELLLPAGSAGVVTTPDFPKPPFSGWRIGRFLNKEEAAIPNGTVSVANSVVTLKEGHPFPLSMPAGVKIQIGTTWYTVASVQDGKQLTLTEPSLSLESASYQLGGFGVRLRKKTGTGVIQVNASWALAWTSEPAMPLNGELDLCSRLTFPVDYEADGVTRINPSRTGMFCVLTGMDARLLVLVIPETGETRVLSSLEHADAGSGTPPRMPLGAFSSSDPLTLFAYHGDDSVSSARALYSISYDAAKCHFRAWTGNNYLFPGPAAATDCLNWRNLTPAKEKRDVITQFQTAVAGNPFWNPSVMANGDLSFSGIAGNYALFTKFFAGPQDTPCFMTTFDLRTGNLVQVTDSFGGSSPSMRWGSCHTTPATMVDQWIAPALTILISRNGPGYLSGPFKIRSVSAVSKDGGATWLNDTSLNSSETGLCTTTDPRMVAKGATGSRCVKIRITSEYPCSLSPANGDAARFPCPWNSSLAGPMPLIAGDYLSDLGKWPDTFEGKAEKMLITSKTDIGGGNWELELMRWATCDDQMWTSHITSPYTAIHQNGWDAYMTGTGMCGGTYAWFDAADTTHTFYPDNSAVTADHGATGPAPKGLYATIVMGGAARIGGIPEQFNQPAMFVQNQNTTSFAGVRRDAGSDVESYPNLGQWTASDAEKQYAFDLRHLNPGYGSGPERPSGIWRQKYVLVPGAKQLYKIDNYGGVFGKVFPYLAFAGRNLLKDMSGPSSFISDADEWRYCVAYQPGECRPDSSAKDAFVNVPRASLSDGCVVNTYAYNYPCFTTPYSFGAWALQYRYNRDDPDGKLYRRMTMGFTGPGRQYQFQNVHVTPEGRWAFLGPGWVDGVRSSILMVKVPPLPEEDTVDRSTYLPVHVAVDPDTASSTARVRFGYAEHGAVGDFYCTSRRESCVSDTLSSPFAFEKSDSLTPAPCASGCTITVPALPARVLYYRVERLSDAGMVVSTGPTQIYVAP